MSNTACSAPSIFGFHDSMYQLNLLAYTQERRHKFNPQGQKCIVYHFAPLFWLLNYPDLALHQLRRHIKRKLRPQKLLSSRAERCAIACAWFIIFPSHGSDLSLRTGDDSRRFGCGSSGPGFCVSEHHIRGITRHLRGNQSPRASYVCAAGRMEPHREENCPR